MKFRNLAILCVLILSCAGGAWLYASKSDAENRADENATIKMMEMKNGAEADALERAARRPVI